MATKQANSTFPMGKAKEFIQQAQELNPNAVNNLYFGAVLYNQSTIKPSLKSFIQFLESELHKRGMDTGPEKHQKPVSSLAGAPDLKKVQDS